jgi:coenzyme F420-0:L-glutamate ligase/coenzyme F420-1:gamma-L-glutamate ligase
MTDEVRLIPIRRIPEARPGDSVAELVLTGMAASGLTGEEGDVLVVTQKLVSKAEGRVVALAGIEPSPFAIAYGQRWGAIRARSSWCFAKAHGSYGWIVA